MAYKKLRYFPITPRLQRLFMSLRIAEYKKLRYFPITPRLQRLFISPRTAEHMT